MNADFISVGGVKRTPFRESSESETPRFRAAATTPIASRIFDFPEPLPPATALDGRVSRKLDKYRSIWDQTRSAFDFPEDVQRQFDAIAKFAIYAPQTEFLREIKTGTVDEPPIGLHGEGLAAAVSSLLSQLEGKNKKQTYESIGLARLPGWTKEFGVDTLDPALKSTGTADGGRVYFVDEFMHTSRNRLSAYDASEGTLFLLFIAVLIGHEQSPPIFALDNVDSALNPSLTRKLIEHLIDAVEKKRSNRRRKFGPDQIFLTSHNPTSLDAFDLLDDDQRVFVVARNNEGHTVATRLQPAEGMTRDDWARVSEGRKLSQMWIDGEIVGALGQSL